MGGKKKSGDGANSADTIEGDIRTEGMDAHVFSQPIGYIPQFPAPPKYIRVGFRRIFAFCACWVLIGIVGSFA
jgi:hypothetical protein